MVTGNPTPHFLSVCRPNYTALGCPPPSPERPGPDRFVTDQGACAGSPSLVAAARRAFPCKDAALCAYAVTYTAVSPQMGDRSWGGGQRAGGHLGWGLRFFPRVRPLPVIVKPSPGQSLPNGGPDSSPRALATPPSLSVIVLTAPLGSGHPS